jgi:dihydrodipicolinate reductase
LKGNRREQREEAAFWTGVEDEAQELLHSVEQDEDHHPAKEDAPAERAATRKRAESRATRAQTPKTKTVKTAKATGTRAASSRSESRAKKSSARQKSEKAPASAPRPSQRGFKWPRPE